MLAYYFLQHLAKNARSMQIQWLFDYGFFNVFHDFHNFSNDFDDVSIMFDVEQLTDEVLIEHDGSTSKSVNKKKVVHQQRDEVSDDNKDEWNISTGQLTSTHPKLHIVRSKN